MAKSTGIYGDWSGKIGNLIGYRIHNSNNDITQGIRAYNPNVYNPKTLDQARQRIKVTAAVRFYKAFRDFLSLSYQGKKNGHACYCEQQRLALTASLDDIPMLPRGAEFFVPARYIVASGTLAPRSVVEVAPTGAASSFITNIILDAPIDTSATFGSFSSSLIANNDGLADADTVHFIAAYETPDGHYVPWYASFTLDTTSTVPLASMGVLIASLQTLSADNNLYRLAVNLRAAAARSSRCGGAAVAVSRGDGASQSATLWSTATMTVATFVVEEYFYAAAYAAAILTYLPAPVPASALTLNQAGTTPPVTRRNPYITDGLVFMLDGIWNNALFDHQDNPETWRDIIGGLTPNNSPSNLVFNSNNVFIPISQYLLYELQGLSQLFNNNQLTIELLFKGVELNDNRNMNVFTFSQSSVAFQLNSTLGNAYYRLRLKSSNPIQTRISVAKSLKSIIKIVLKDNIATVLNTLSYQGGNQVINDVNTFVLNGLYNVHNNSSMFYALRIYSRNLTEAELAHNNALDTQRFGWLPLGSSLSTMAYDGSPLPLHPSVLDTEMPTLDTDPYDETIQI